MKFMFSLLVAVIVGSLSCSAADLDLVDYYSLTPVESLSPTVNSALDYAVQPLSATSWDTSDQTNLRNIRDALVSSYSGAYSGSIYSNVDSIQDWIAKIGNVTVSSSSTASTLLSNLEDINDWLNASDIPDYLSDLKSGLVGNTASVLWYAREIYSDVSQIVQDTDYLYHLESIDSRMLNVQNFLASISSDMNSVISHISSIDTGVSAIGPIVDDIKDDLIEFTNYFMLVRDVDFSTINPDGSVGDSYEIGSSLGYLLTYGMFNLYVDGYFDGNDNPTLFHLIKRLADVQASYDDVQLAESQKANREEIEDSFLNGSSGSTSLGVSDFGDLADVGGTIKDSLSLDGNATIGSFTSGLAAADSAGQGWFSEETRFQLDAVSSTVTYSLRDSDPYNMAGWEDRYYWLLGDDE